MYKYVAFTFFFFVIAGVGCSNTLSSISLNRDVDQSRQLAIDTVQVLEDGRPIYNIKIKYPQISQPIDDATNAFNAYVKKLIEDQFIIEFKARAAGADASVNSAHTLVGEYKVLTQLPNYFAFRMDFSEYLGGAHPNSWSYTVDYIFANGGELVDLDDIFTVEEPVYLAQLSESSRSLLTTQLGVDADTLWIEKGTEPIKSNFRNFNLTDEGMVIMFDAYQVAAYAVGPQEIVIPYSGLEDILDENGPVSFLR